MQKVITWLKAHWQSTLFVAGLLGCAILFMFGPGWSDLANKPFWQVAWIVFCVLGFIGFAGGIYWLVTKQKKLD